jgi:hypothetical protein
MTAQPCGVQHEDNVKKNPRIFDMRSSVPRDTEADGDWRCRHHRLPAASLKDDAHPGDTHLRLTQAEGAGD